jgi:outer membrane immunogenic protein
MRHLVVAGMALAAIIAGPAAAADMAARAPAAPAYKAPPPVALYNWSGFYVGGHVGYSWMDSTDQIVGFDGPSAAFLAANRVTTSIPLRPKGAIGGVQAGFNWQAPGSIWVWGLEADISGTGLRDTGTLDLFASGRPMTASEKLDWFGTVRGRVGVAPWDRGLVYVTGGLAYGHVSLSTAMSNINSCAGNNCQSGSTGPTKAGWTAGAGAEWAFFDNWSLKVEYLYFNLGSVSHFMTDPNFVFVFDASATIKGSIARVGLNYRFGGPVVARY